MFSIRVFSCWFMSVMDKYFFLNASKMWQVPVLKSNSMNHSKTPTDLEINALAGCSVKLLNFSWNKTIL